MTKILSTTGKTIYESPLEAVKETVMEAIEKGADLSGADLSGVNLSGVNLSWVNFSGANLSWANFSGTNLSGVNLSWVNFSGANLSWANFSGANLSGVNLSGTNLSGANLSGTNLSGVNLSGVNLSWVNFSGADLSEANLSGADLSGADLSGADAEIWWHIHHEKLWEPLTEPIRNRINYIKSKKPENEHELRLKLMKPVLGKFPKDEKGWEELHKIECGCGWDSEKKTIFTPANGFNSDGTPYAN